MPSSSRSRPCCRLPTSGRPLRRSTRASPRCTPQVYRHISLAPSVRALQHTHTHLQGARRHGFPLPRQRVLCNALPVSPCGVRHPPHYSFHHRAHDQPPPITRVHQLRPIAGARVKGKERQEPRQRSSKMARKARAGTATRTRRKRLK